MNLVVQHHHHTQVAQTRVGIFERAGHLIARSTLAQWVGECGAQLQPLVNVLADELRRHAVLHADETPVAMLKPQHLSNGKTHKAYIWSYCTTSLIATKAVVFHFALGRSNWLFAGSLRAGQRAAAVMSLVHSAKINGHDPYAYLKDVLERLLTLPPSRIAELLPHRWQSEATVR